jgi:ankyrin repeat protein
MIQIGELNYEKPTSPKSPVNQFGETPYNCFDANEKNLLTTSLSDRIEQAFANRDIEQLLTFIHEDNVSSNYQRSGTGNTPLILAVREGNEDAVNILLSSKSDPNLGNAKGRTPLMCAAASGYEHIITLLLIKMTQGQERIKMLFQRDDSGKTALDWARIGRRYRCKHTLELSIARSIEFLRRERFNADQMESLRLLVEENRNRRVLIQHAIINRDTESIQDLARPLDRAQLRWDSSNKVMTLESLRRGDFNYSDQTNDTTCDSSSSSSSKVNDDNSEITPKKNQPFYAKRPNIGKGIIVGVANRAALENAVEEMMKDGGRIVDAAPRHSVEFAHPDRHVLFADHECMGGVTPLMYAAGNDVPDLITLLVRRAGADINLRSSRMGHTPLTWAACSGALSTVQILLSEGAELDLPTSEGRTALMVACSRSNKHMVSTLLECSMYLAQRRAARDSNAQYNSLVRVLGHEIASQARYSNAGKDNEGWQYYFDHLVFGMKDQDGRNAVVHARMSGGGKYKRDSGSSSGHTAAVVDSNISLSSISSSRKGHKNLITEMLEQAKTRIIERQQKLAHQRWIVEPVKCELCGNWEKRNRMEKHAMYNCPMRLVRCRYCNVSMPSKMTNTHVDNECERRLLKCPQKCGKDIEARHMNAHGNNFCARRIVLCRLDCGAKCHFNTRTQHEVDLCPNRQVDCPDCNLNMQAKELNYHLYNKCPQRLVFCGRGCGHRGPYILNEKHENSECLLRPLPCRYEHLNCPIIIGPPDKREIHELYLCPKRPVSCKFGLCQHVCRSEELEYHQKNDCLYRMVECNNKCGMSILAKDREAHERPGETGLCLNRPVRCRHDWIGNRVRVHRAISDIKSSSLLENPGNTPHSKWEDGIVVGFESVKIPEEEVTDDKNKQNNDDNDDDGDNNKSNKINPMRKGEGSTTRLKVRFTNHTEWVNAGASYNFHSITEGNGDYWECTWVSALSRDNHEANSCGHRMVTCTLGCEQQIAAKHLKRHQEETCPYRTTLCPQGCEQQIPLKQLSDHKDEFCVKRIVECDSCEESMKQDELFEHMRVDCMMHRIRCPNACSQQVRRIKLQDHLNNKCPKRIIQCKWKCDTPIFADAKIYHETKICSKREVTCKNGDIGCGESILFFMMKDHIQNYCGRRIVKCSLNCGKSLMKIDELNHQSNFCPKRPYQCYLGCGKTIPVCNRKMHEENYCMRRIRSCTLGCGRIVRADMMAKHVTRNCRRRIVGCPHGCDDIVRAEDVHAHGAMCGMRPVECGARSHACCRQLRQWTRMVPIDGPFPSLPYVPPIPQTDKEKRKEEEKNEFNPDRDGLPNGTQDQIVLVDDNLITNGGNTSSTAVAIGTPLIRYQRVLILCQNHQSTGLHRAAAMGDLDLVRAIIGGLSKKDLNYEDPEGTTPLMRASFHGHATIVRVLVESGAMIDHETSRGRTAMMDAVIQNHPSVVWELMMLGGEYTRPNKFGQIPLKMAVRYDTRKTRERTHKDEFGTSYTCMELVTEIAKLRNEYKDLLIAISNGNYNQIKKIVNGGELHRPCHIHQLHSEKPILANVLLECKEKATHFYNEMMYCKQVSDECNIRVKILQRKLRENAESQQMIKEEEASWSFAAHERHEEVISVLRGLSAMHVSEVIKLGRHPPPIVEILLKGLCILRGVPPVVGSNGKRF